jgi:hypothetical protein
MELSLYVTKDDASIRHQHNLDKKFEVQGIVKPNCELSSNFNTGIKNITSLTTKDVVTIWGRTKDVSKNEAIAGLSHIRKFVEKYNNTNILVMELPDRCDLSANSCVNVEWKSFNRKLSKYMQPFKHAPVVEIYCNRSYCTRHGLHLNYKGKEFLLSKSREKLKGFSERLYLFQYL